MLKIASFANKDQEVSAHENGEDEQDSDDSDIEMYEPPEPTVDRGTLRGDPKSEVKAENGVVNGLPHSNGMDDAGDMLLAAARAGFLNGSAPVAAAASEIDDIAATEEEERVITEQMARQPEQVIPSSSTATQPIIIKGDRRTYWCELCKVDLSSEPTKASHQNGTKHIQKRQNHILDYPEDADRVWIHPVANPPPAKKKIPVRVHTKIRESEVPVIGLDCVIETLPTSDPEQEPMYECTVCGNRGSNANGIFSHLTGQQHRHNVMKKRGHLRHGDANKYAKERAENHDDLEKAIRTVRDDLKYPWPPGQAPWSLERGGTGIHPSTVGATPTIKTESKPAISKLNTNREIIPNPGEIADIKCDEEASRYIALAMEIMNLLGENARTARRANLAILEAKKRKPISPPRASQDPRPGPSGIIRGSGRNPFQNYRKGEDSQKFNRSSRSMSNSPDRSGNRSIKREREDYDRDATRRPSGDTRVFNKHTGRYEEPRVSQKRPRSRSPGDTGGQRARYSSTRSRSPQHESSYSRHSYSNRVSEERRSPGQSRHREYRDSSERYSSSRRSGERRSESPHGGSTSRWSGERSGSPYGGSTSRRSGERSGSPYGGSTSRRSGERRSGSPYGGSSSRRSGERSGSPYGGSTSRRSGERSGSPHGDSSSRRSGERRSGSPYHSYSSRRRSGERSRSPRHSYH